MESKAHTLAAEWAFETNGHKWSNNNSEAGDNYGSFIAGYQAAEKEYAALQAKCERYKKALKDIELVGHGGTPFSIAECKRIANEALAWDGEKEEKPLPFEDIKFMESCNLYPHANNSVKILTENDEGAWLEKEDLIKLSAILYKYANQKEDKQ